MDLTFFIFIFTFGVHIQDFQYKKGIWRCSSIKISLKMPILGHVCSGKCPFRKCLGEYTSAIIGLRIPFWKSDHIDDRNSYLSLNQNFVEHT